jgi:hypothetical protein
LPQASFPLLVLPLAVLPGKYAYAHDRCLTFLTVPGLAHVPVIGTVSRAGKWQLGSLRGQT